MTSYRATPPSPSHSSSSSYFIFSLSPDYRVSGPSNGMDAITDLAGGPGKEDFSGTNWAMLPPPQPIPPSEKTGYRGNGTMYDTSDMWLLSAFSLSETSDPEANETAMIGFAHVEDRYTSSFLFQCFDSSRQAYR